MEIITAIGYAAAFFTAAGYFPQVYKSWKTKQTRDVSFLAFATLLIATSLWLLYGYNLGDKPIILTNSAIFILILSQLYLKFKYK